MINVTNNAINKIYTLIEEDGNTDLKLRVFVTGGGCSGLQYGFTFEENKNEDDFEFLKEFEGKKIVFLIDSLSSQYLNGADIDYQEDINGTQFIIKNPNATTSCGCGSSFSI